MKSSDQRAASGLLYSGKAGAGDGIRTRDIDLGKVALYQLSYSRALETIHFLPLQVVLSIAL
jgi:hypothetical protein